MPTDFFFTTGHISRTLLSGSLPNVSSFFFFSTLSENVSLLWDGKKNSHRMRLCANGTQIQCCVGPKSVRDIQGRMGEGVVVMKYPIITAPQFEPFSLYTLTRSSQSIQIKLLIHPQSEKNKFFVHDPIRIKVTNQHCLHAACFICKM